MSTPLLTIIIPTYNRPDLLQRAVQSALAQAADLPEGSLEIVVVDDGSSVPASLPAQASLRLVRLPDNCGGAAARNEGARVAQGRYITYLDDDDKLLPGMAAAALKALRETILPQPVAVLTGIEVVNSSGQVVNTRLPPTLPKGSCFSLEEIEPEESFLTKQTLVVERNLLLSIGGFDQTFRSRVHSELFLRLNPACSLLGLPLVTYQLAAHEGPRVSRNPALRQASFDQLVKKHRAQFEAHPKQFSRFVYQHAQVCLRMGQNKAAFKALLWAVRIHPSHSLILIMREFRHRLSPYLATFNAEPLETT
ncbi:MAG: glycosyltransferase family 2 protein [Phormidesmis sp.]